MRKMYGMYHINALETRIRWIFGNKCQIRIDIRIDIRKECPFADILFYKFHVADL